MARRRVGERQTPPSSSPYEQPRTYQDRKDHGQAGNGPDQAAVTGRAGDAGPPVGPALGQHGVNIGSS